jgi:hypothetical protein
MRRLARLLPFIAILLLLTIAALVLLRTGPLADHIRAVIASELAKALDRDVSIGSAGFTSSGRVALHDVLVRNDDGSALLKAPHVSVQVAAEGGLLSLLSGSADIRSVRLVEPELTLARRPDGKLTVSDLLERPREAPPRFRGSVEMVGGKITFVDEANDGLTTSLTGVRTSFEYPRPDKAVFEVEVGENAGIFDLLQLEGEINTETGATSVDFRTADGVVIPYVLARIPELGFGEISSGTADLLTGEISFGAGEEAALRYDVTMQLNDVEVIFPWLRRPLQQVKGEMQVADGAVIFRKVAGTVADTSVTVNGAVRDFSAPYLDLVIESRSVAYTQVRELLPELPPLPAWLVPPDPLEVSATVSGPPPNVAVVGRASVDVIEFGEVPWHELVIEFDYDDGQLTVRPSAHGSARRFDAEVELDLLEPALDSGEFHLTDVPLSTLAEMAGIQGDFRGTVGATVSAEVSSDGAFSGTVHVTYEYVEGTALAKLGGEFEYTKEMILLPELRVSGPVATGSVEAELYLTGDYKIIDARFTELDLSAVGLPAALEVVPGRHCAQVREAKGHVGDQSFNGHVELGPGEFQGRSFRSFSGDLAVSPRQVRVADLDLQVGDGNCAGKIIVDDWRGPRAGVDLSGHLGLTGVGLSEWVPPELRAISPSGTVSGSVDVAGTLADPVVDVDLTVESLSIAGQPLDGGGIEARYEDGGLVVKEGHVGIAGADLSFSGGYAPETGLSLELDGEDIELDGLPASWGSQLGLALTGTLTAKADVTGPLTEPKVSFSLDAQPLGLNQEEFDKLAIRGGFQDSTLQIDSFELAQGESTISLSGAVRADDGAIEAAALDLTEVDIGVLARIADRAVDRLAEAPESRPRSPFVEGYDRVVDRLGGLPTGSLTAEVRGSGSIEKPQIDDASFSLHDFDLDGRDMEDIEGPPRARGPDGAVLEGADLDVSASDEIAHIAGTASVSADGSSEVKFVLKDLDLQRVYPLAIPYLTSGTLNGSLWLTGGPDSGEVLLATRAPDELGDGPLVVSDAVFEVLGGESDEPSAEVVFAPQLDVDIVVGENVEFHYEDGHEIILRRAEVEIEPGPLLDVAESTGHLHVGGTATGEGVELTDGKFESREGELAFPPLSSSTQRQLAVSAITTCPCGRLGRSFHTSPSRTLGRRAPCS